MNDQTHAHFDALSPEQKAQAIRSLASQGFSDLACASASRLSVEMVRTILGPQASGRTASGGAR